MEAGLHYNLKVVRKTDIGYMLKFMDSEVLLHKNEAFRDLEIGEEVRVFIYYDAKKRLAATMSESILTLEKPAWVSVKSVVHGLGVFLDVNINKDILLSAEYLPYDDECWPNVGDKLFCMLKNKGRLIAKVCNLNDSKAYAMKESILLHDNVVAYVTRINPEGIGLFTKNLTYIYVHKTQMRKKYRLGEEVSVNITAINERGYQGTLIKQKENMIDDDSVIVLNYLKNHNKVMNFDSDSSPEDILKTFNMSKKAFKRALGHLYKERVIDFKDGKTVLVKE